MMDHMGRVETPFAKPVSAIQRLPGTVVVVAGTADIAALRAQDGPGAIGGLRLLELGSAEDVPSEVVREASLLVIELDPASPGSFQRIAGLRAAAPHLQLIVALRDAGTAVLLVSVELDEIMSLSDRIAVMFDGQLMGFRDPETTDERELGLLMAGMNGEAA